jgi:uncharacterized 2Fe-2S/4Fe-4S cluster protein (DUF4445 family)
MIKINKNKNLLAELQRLNHDVEALCNGKGICGKCLVKVSPHLDPTEIELERLSQQQLHDGVRLACQHPELETDVRVEILGHLYSIEGFDKSQIDTSKLSSDYGLAVDVGTTTVVFVLVEKKTGEIIDEKKFMNPQRVYGADVLTRIEHTLIDHNKDNHRVIIKLIQNYLQSIISILEGNTLKIGITGNTTMMHFICDVDVSSLVQIPYHTTIKEEIIWPIAKMFDIEIDGYCHVYKPFSAYIGSDVLAGLAWCHNQYKHSSQMLIDLGTNGEIALTHNNHVYITSTAAGPAFEGVHMTHGIGSVSGAIDHIGIHQGNVVYSTIDDKLPIGICGSGYVDAMACLLQKGMEMSGYLEQDWQLSDSIKVTSKDVRQFQLAKAAIRSGMDMLCTHVNVDYKQIEALYIAGGFGKHLNLQHARMIGLIPKSCKNKTFAIGNASLLGCMMWVTNQAVPFTKQQEESFHLIELASDETWKELFTDHLFFLES